VAVDLLLDPFGQGQAFDARKMLPVASQEVAIVSHDDPCDEAVRHSDPLPFPFQVTSNPSGTIGPGAVQGKRP